MTKLKILKEYRCNNLKFKIYKRLKSNTFLGAIFIYAVAIGNFDDSNPLYEALGVLFLLDTYIEQRFDRVPPHL